MEERIKQQKDYYNKLYQKDLRKKVRRFYIIATSAKEDYFNIIYRNCNKNKILEYGCGLGSSAFALALRGAQVTGIDISDCAIKKAKEKAKEKDLNIDFRVMNAEMLKFGDNSFDMICGTGILHHLDLNRSIPEVNRVLKKGGKAVFLEPLGHNIFINLFRFLTPRLRTEDEHPLRWQDLQYMMTKFSSVEISCYFLFALLSIPFIKFNWFNRILRILNQIDSKIFLLFPYFKRYTWQILIQMEK